MQKEFADRIVKTMLNDDSIVGLAVGGSWLSNELDRYSDLDLILVTENRISGDPSKMLEYAGRFGNLLAGFTGEHVGEPRLLICLYEDPLLHVDIKFLVPDEFETRVENPVILYDPSRRLEHIINSSRASFPMPDYQWIEDRFWIWTHYVLTKIGRGEYFEAFDTISFIRMQVLGPLSLIKSGNLPKGVRKVEMLLSKSDLQRLKTSVPEYDRISLQKAIKHCAALYSSLRAELYPSTVQRREKAEVAVIFYMDQII